MSRQGTLSPDEAAILAASSGDQSLDQLRERDGEERLHIILLTDPSVLEDYFGLDVGKEVTV